jgi:hypothetical protein
MKGSIRKPYFIALAVLLLLSAYPLVMGAKIVFIQLQNGSIQPQDYARYVIPYTAVSISILISAALYPLVARLGKLSVPAATVLALALFVAVELCIEHITINSPAVKSAVQWQLASCIGTTAAVQAFQYVYNDAFKIHYFLVSFVLIALIVSVFYGYIRQRTDARRSRLPLGLQFCSTVLLLGLCVFANFTGFFRNTSDYLSPLSSLLTGAFFVVLGAALGVYAGSFLLNRGKLLSLGLPAAVAVLVCTVMYVGETNLLGGTLYRFGISWFFQGLPGIVAAPVDIAVIVAAGGVALAVMAMARRALRWSSNRRSLLWVE